MLTPRLMLAINTAAIAHNGHVRKGTNIPYISHLYGVMTLAASVTDNEDIFIACLLHDAIEDVPETYGATQICADFGPQVLDIVQEVTKSELPGWQERSEAYLEHLSTKASEAAVLVSLCDKTHNLMSILADYEGLGDELWGRFNSGKERQQWWYRSIGEVAAQRIPNCVLLPQYNSLVAELESL